MKTTSMPLSFWDHSMTPKRPVVASNHRKPLRRRRRQQNQKAQAKSRLPRPNVYAIVFTSFEPPGAFCNSVIPSLESIGDWYCARYTIALRFQQDQE